MTNNKNAIYEIQFNHVWEVWSKKISMNIIPQVQINKTPPRTKTKKTKKGVLYVTVSQATCEKLLRSPWNFLTGPRNNVFGNISTRFELICLCIGYLNREFFLKSHNKFHSVKTIKAQVLLEISFFRNLWHTIFIGNRLGYQSKIQTRIKVCDL